MNSLAALITWNGAPALNKTVHSLQRCETVKTITAALPEGIPPPPSGVVSLGVSGHWSKSALLAGLKWFQSTGTDHLLLITGPDAPIMNADGLRRMITCLQETDAAMVYGDYFELQPDGSLRLQQCIDYQSGSIRDTFNFGPVMLISGGFTNSIQKIINASTPDLAFGALYDLRLRLSEFGPIHRLPEPLYCCPAEPADSPVGTHFAYVDPRNRDYQIEMEKIATAHLQRIGACLQPRTSLPLVEEGVFPVMASIVIPVKNRCRTIGDAVNSALAQKADFPFNVIVIDNHSNDGTTSLLAEITRSDRRLVHLVPERKDLLIGGCWNEAIYSKACGRYAVQLDSDDLYDGNGVLTRIVTEIDKKPYALMIGSYTTVDFDLQPLPPGLIDHREWTDDNGMNNALRIAGLGAPRAYHVPTLRQFGFPNVSYGEDYAVVLRLSRSYPVGRIYDSLYWCRRWDENSDSRLPPETVNRYDHYKDRLRTLEIAARSRREPRQ